MKTKSKEQIVAGIIEKYLPKHGHKIVDSRPVDGGWIVGAALKEDGKKKPSLAGVFVVNSSRVTLHVRDAGIKQIPQALHSQTYSIINFTNSLLTVPFFRLTRIDSVIEAARDIPICAVEDDEALYELIEGTIGIFVKYGTAMQETLDDAVSVFCPDKKKKGIEESAEGLLGALKRLGLISCTYPGDDDEDDDHLENEEEDDPQFERLEAEEEEDDDKDFLEAIKSGKFPSLSEFFSSVTGEEKKACKKKKAEAKEKKEAKGKPAKKPGRPKKA